MSDEQQQANIDVRVGSPEQVQGYSPGNEARQSFVEDRVDDDAAPVQ